MHTYGLVKMFDNSVNSECKSAIGRVVLNREILASRLLKNMDREVEPCDDFYDFACGGFLKSTIIPDDKTTVNTFTGISDELQNQLRTSIEEKSPPNEPKPFRLVKNLYKACMNKSEYVIHISFSFSPNETNKNYPSILISILIPIY